MGTALFLGSIIAIIVFFSYIMNKDRTKNKRVIVTLALVILASIIISVWYYTPFRVSIPLNAIIKIKHDNGEIVEIAITKQEESQNIIENLNNLWLQRTMTKTDGAFHSGRRVRADDYFIIEVYLPSESTDGDLKHLGDYCFIISLPEFATFVLPSYNNRNKFNILNEVNAKDIILICTEYF